MTAVACPVTRCREPNDATADACVRCGTPLQAYVRMSSHAAALFNRGLAAAREGRLSEARDLFASVVRWCPVDLEARNAHALACLRLGDKDAARRAWETVLARSPRNEFAAMGVAVLTDTPTAEPAAAPAPASPGTSATAGQPPKTNRSRPTRPMGRKKRRRRRR